MLYRTLFTFGTLYPDEMITALLGEIPDNSFAAMPGYSVYKGTASQLPEKVRQSFDAQHFDPATFSYVFAKPDLNATAPIQGRAYKINLEQEFIIDHWERYPDWYHKRDVVIVDEHDEKFEAFIYTLNIEGEKITNWQRVMNDPEKALANARRVREMAVNELTSY